MDEITQPEGFPLIPRERKALDHIAEGKFDRPKGAGSQTITTLLSRKWIERIGLDQYVLTTDGQFAQDFDNLVVGSGFSRPSNAGRPGGASAYKDLKAKFDSFREQISN